MPQHSRSQRSAVLPGPAIRRVRMRTLTLLFVRFVRFVRFAMEEFVAKGRAPNGGKVVL